MDGEDEPEPPDPRPCVSNFSLSISPSIISERPSTLSAPFIPFSPIISLPDALGPSTLQSLALFIFLAVPYPQKRAHAHQRTLRQTTRLQMSRPCPKHDQKKRRLHPLAPRKKRRSVRTNILLFPQFVTRPTRPFTDADFASTSSFSFTLETKDAGSETIDFFWGWRFCGIPEVRNNAHTTRCKYTTTTPRRKLQKFSPTKRSRTVLSQWRPTLPEHFRIERRTPSNPLADLPPLPHHPPEFTPGKRYTAERKDAMKVNPDGFLLRMKRDLCTI